MYEFFTVLALILGASWPLYQVYLKLRGPHLRVRLTTEFFFRISTVYGESLFVKPVLLAENGNILVEGVTGSLQRTTPGSMKKWEVEFKRFGEVVRNPREIFSDHYFHGSSPLQFLVQDIPLRAVYQGDLQGYSAEFMKLVSKLSDKIIAVRNGLPNHLTTLRDITTMFQKWPEDDQKQLTEAFTKMTELGEEYSSKLVEQIQLEEGDYELTVTIEYRALSGIWSSKKNKAASKIGFSVEKTVRTKMKSAFPSALSTEMRNVIFGSNLPVNSPEYKPTSIWEIGH